MCGVCVVCMSVRVCGFLRTWVCVCVPMRVFVVVCVQVFVCECVRE